MEPAWLGMSTAMRPLRHDEYHKQFNGLHPLSVAYGP